MSLYYAETSYVDCRCAVDAGVCDAGCLACRGYLHTCPRSAPDDWITSGDAVMRKEAARALVARAVYRLVGELLDGDGYDHPIATATGGIA